MLYCYQIPPIDTWSVGMTGKDLLFTLNQYASSLDEMAANARKLSNLEKDARESFMRIGWEGDVTAGPFFFSVPGHEWEFGYILKQSNNGATFVASPREMPELESLSLHAPYVLSVRRSA